MPQPTAPPVLLELPPETQQLQRDLLATHAWAIAAEAQVADLQATVAPVTLPHILGGKRQSGISRLGYPIPTGAIQSWREPANPSSNLRLQQLSGYTGLCRSDGGRS